jgi:hypothetical protein
VKSPDAVLSHREFLSDANDADQSGAGDTEDAEGTSTSVEEEDVQAERAAVAPPVEKDVGDKEGAAEEEEDEMDAETRRKLELRERMAKMSGGMGMAGMFGGPRGMPPPPPKKKPVGLEKRSTDESINHPQQRVAMLPMSGMPIVKSPDSEDTQLGEEREDMTPYPHTSPSHQVQDESDTENAPTYDRPPAIPQESKFLIPRKPVDRVREYLDCFQSSSSETVSKTYVASDGKSEYMMTVSVLSMFWKTCQSSIILCLLTSILTIIRATGASSYPNCRSASSSSFSIN